MIRGLLEEQGCAGRAGFVTQINGTAISLRHRPMVPGYALHLARDDGVGWMRECPSDTEPAHP